MRAHRSRRAILFLSRSTSFNFLDGFEISLDSGQTAKVLKTARCLSESYFLLLRTNFPPSLSCSIPFQVTESQVAMSYFVNTSYLRAGHRSVTNPNKFVRNSASSGSLRGRSISTSITSPNLCSSKPNLKLPKTRKTAAFASLGVNAAFTDVRLSSQ